MFAIVVTGPPGAGKTSVLEALSDQLADDVRHAMIDIEALTATHPALDEDRWLAHAAWEAEPAKLTRRITEREPGLVRARPACLGGPLASRP